MIPIFTWRDVTAIVYPSEQSRGGWHAAADYEEGSWEKAARRVEDMGFEISVIPDLISWCPWLSKDGTSLFIFSKKRDGSYWLGEESK